MNSIVFTHFVTPVQGASRRAIALHRFGAWFDAEISSLGDLLDIAGHDEADDDIEVLHGLHLDTDAEPGDLERLLEEARSPLERLLERVRTIPLGDPPAGTIPSDFDAWVRWSGARLEDILATLRHALAV